MKSVREIFRDTLGRYVPYFLVLLVAMIAVWFVNTFFGLFSSQGERLRFVCYVVIGCTSTLASLVICLYKRVMNKLEEIQESE